MTSVQGDTPSVQAAGWRSRCPDSVHYVLFWLRTSTRSETIQAAPNFTMHRSSLPSVRFGPSDGGVRAFATRDLDCDGRR